MGDGRKYIAGDEFTAAGVNGTSLCLTTAYRGWLIFMSSASRFARCVINQCS